VSQNPDARRAAASLSEGALAEQQPLVVLAGDLPPGLLLAGAGNPELVLKTEMMQVLWEL